MTNLADVRTTPPAEPAMRLVLRLDAALCIVSGGLAAGASRPVADVLGAGTPAPVRLAGAVLVLYGIALASLAGTSRPVVRAATAVSALADAGWVVASVAIVVGGLLGPVFLVVSVPVAALGAAKSRLLRREPALA